MKKLMAGFGIALCIYTMILYALTPQKFVEKYINTYNQKYSQQYKTLYADLNQAFNANNISRIQQLLGGIKLLAQEEKTYLLTIETEYRRLKRSPVNLVGQEVTPRTELFEEQQNLRECEPERTRPFMSAQAQVDQLLQQKFENFDQWLKKRREHQHAVERYIADADKRFKEVQHTRMSNCPPAPPAFLAPSLPVSPAQTSVGQPQPPHLPQRPSAPPVPPAFLIAPRQVVKPTPPPTPPAFLVPSPAPRRALPMPTPPAFLTNP